MKFAVLALMTYLAVGYVDSSADMMKKLDLKFSEALDECKDEWNLNDAVAQDFTNFWIEDYEVTNRDTGCAIYCLAKKVDILDSEGHIHHGSAMEFAKEHGADEAMANQLISLVHGCEKSTPVNEDFCVTTLHVAVCFKAEIHKLNWAPSLDLVVGEILAEI